MFVKTCQILLNLVTITSRNPIACCCGVSVPSIGKQCTKHTGTARFGSHTNKMVLFLIKYFVIMQSWCRHQMETFPRYWPPVRGTTDHRWIPLTKTNDAFSLICVWTNEWVNNRDAGDLRRRCAHYYDVTIINGSTRLDVLHQFLVFLDPALLQRTNAVASL